MLAASQVAARHASHLPFRAQRRCGTCACFGLAVTLAFEGLYHSKMLNCITDSSAAVIESNEPKALLPSTARSKAPNGVT